MTADSANAHISGIRLHPIKALDLQLSCFLVLLAFYCGTNIFSPIRFDREKIEVYAANGHIRVSGLYHYRNRFPLPAALSLGLPFPTDATHAVPSAYSVTEIASDGSAIGEIPTGEYQGSVVFRLFFLPSHEKWIRIDYLQNVAVANGRYLLRTTRAWKRPLAEGEYVLHLDRAAELFASNYFLEKLPSRGESRYSFTRTDFLPEEDWIFSWKSSAPLAASR